MSETIPVLHRLRDGLRSLGETIAAYLDGDLAAERAGLAVQSAEGQPDDVEAGPWIVAARVEGDEAKHLPGGPLTAPRLKATADSYDPAFRRAPVILTHDEKAGAVVGYVEETDFDGVNLMVRVSELEAGEDGIGRLTRAVADGWRQRSVKIALREPALEGNPPYLYHLALLSAQQPGTPDLPHLDSTFLRSDAETETVTRAILDDVETAAQEDSMTQEDVTRAVTDAVAPLATRIDELQAELAATREQLEAARQATEQTVADARRSEVEAAVRELVSDGRLTPADQEGEVEVLLALPADRAEARIANLRQRTRLLRSTGSPVSQRGGEVAELDRRFTDPNGRSYPSGEALRIVSEAEKAAGGDPAKVREFLYREHGETAPGLPRA